MYREYHMMWSTVDRPHRRSTRNYVNSPLDFKRQPSPGYGCSSSRRRSTYTVILRARLLKLLLPAASKGIFSISDEFWPQSFCMQPVMADDRLLPGPSEEQEQTAYSNV